MGIEKAKNEETGRLMVSIRNSKNYETEMVNRVNELKNNNYLKFKQLDDNLQVEVKKKIRRK